MLRHKILVVDDEWTIAATLSAIFESQSYETATASSGEEAVQVAGSFQPDCIVSDVMMGAMNGIDAAMEILSMLPQCQVVFMSGNAPCQELLKGAIARGFDFEVLPKPVPVSELLQRIVQIFSSSAGQQGCSDQPPYTCPVAANRPGPVSLEGKPAASTHMAKRMSVAAPARRTA